MYLEEKNLTLFVKNNKEDKISDFINVRNEHIVYLYMKSEFNYQYSKSLVMINLTKNIESQEIMMTDGKHNCIEDILSNKLSNKKSLKKLMMKLIEVELMLDHTTRSINYKLISISRLYDRLLDKDVNRHLKNSGFSLTKTLRDLNLRLNCKDLNRLSNEEQVKVSCEGIDDLISKIILEQKSKRMINRIYS